MKVFKEVCIFLSTHTKDIIALLITLSWCVSMFLPLNIIDEIASRQYERIMLMVLGFYFGAKKYEVKGKDELNGNV